MSATTLAQSFCWHCHSPLEHAASGAHDPTRSEAVAQCPSCASTYRIVSRMEAVTGPAVATYRAVVDDLKAQPLSRFEPQPRGVR